MVIGNHADAKQAIGKKTQHFPGIRPSATSIR